MTRAASAGVQRLSALLAGAGGVFSVFALTACAPMMSLTGFSGSAVQFVATQIDRITLLANGVSYAQTGKTLSERALSNVASADCSTFNVALGNPICSTSKHRAPVEERDSIASVNAKAQLATSAGIGISSRQDSISDALPGTTLPVDQTADIERFDCTSGTPNWHARIAFEARGGQVLGFAYYSIWKPRTCSIHLMRDASGSQWLVAPDGTDHVETPHGRFVIRTSVDAYEFEFQNVQRGKFCGMPGEINGTMMIKRDPPTSTVQWWASWTPTTPTSNACMGQRLSRQPLHIEARTDAALAITPTRLSRACSRRRRACRATATVPLPYTCSQSFALRYVPCTRTV